MIKRLKRNLFILLLCSLTLVFTAVFLLMIRQDLKRKQQSSIAYLNRMATMLIFSMEQDPDYEEVLYPYEKSLGYSFRLISGNGSVLYQSEDVRKRPEIIDTFQNTLQSYQSESYALSPASLRKLSRSSQSAAYTVRLPGRQIYDCVYCEIVTDYGERYGLSVARPGNSPAALLLPELKYYLCIWAGAFLLFLGLSLILTRVIIKPAEQASQSQKDFIAAVSHECKAPLAAILSSAEMIDAVQEVPEAAKEHTRIIEEEVSRMSRLIQDLLLLSSLDAGNWSFHKQEIDVDTLLIGLYSRFEPLCRKKDLKLRLELSEEDYPVFFCDPDRLEQILCVFLDNAVSYSPAGSEITLGAAAEKSGLVLTVADHGPGIRDQDKSSVFRRFYRCDPSRTGRDHFGLGLSIANELAGRLGGTIQLTDTDGGGCTFRLSLPFLNEKSGGRLPPD